MTTSPTQAQGRCAAFYVDPEGRMHVPDWSHGQLRWLELPWRPCSSIRFRSNQIQADWTTILCKVLQSQPGDKPYRLAYMYLEFANTGSLPVSIPTSFSRYENRSYYTSLASPRDYLRVPIVAQSADSTDAVLFPPPRCNQLTNWAISTGHAGSNGLEFSTAAGSRIYGAALVSAPEPDDPSQDLIFARCYFPADEQIVKLDGSQIGLSWPIRFS